MRCFLAIELPEQVIVRLVRLSARLRRCPVTASWVHPENMHLTLRFLGVADGDARATIAAHLREQLSNVHPFTLRVQGAGAFSNLRGPSVLWAAVGPLIGPLEIVQAHCEKAAQRAGFAPETRPFHPHVTLARIKESRPSLELTQSIEREHAFPAGDFVASGVSLFTSELTPRGPAYSRLEEFRYE